MDSQPPGALLQPVRAVPGRDGRDPAGRAAAGPARPTIFHEDWWLDITTDGGWAKVAFRDDRVEGWMPYHVTRAGPFRRITMPPFTHFLGPAVSARPGSASLSFNAEVEVTLRLIEALPCSDHFRQKFHGGVTHVVPFQTLGYATSAQFTLEVEPRPWPALWDAVKPRTRAYIRAAERELSIDETTDATAFRSFYEANLRERGRRPADDMGLAVRLIDACRSRGRGHLLTARSPSGEPKAAIFCVSDARSTYYLLTSRTRSSGNGAVSALVWHAMRRAAAAGLVFDFDGLGHQSSVQFYSSFGGACRPRYTARRSSRTYAALKAVQSIVAGRADGFTDNN